MRTFCFKLKKKKPTNETKKKRKFTPTSTKYYFDVVCEHIKANKNNQTNTKQKKKSPKKTKTKIFKKNLLK